MVLHWLVSTCQLSHVARQDVPASFVLYRCITRDMAEECVAKCGLVRLVHCIGCKHGHIAFRSTERAAWDRVYKFFEDPRIYDFVLLQLTLTQAGQMYATKSMQGAAPLLRKLVLEYSNREWGVWHWNCDLPLTLESTFGRQVLNGSFQPVPDNI